MNTLIAKQSSVKKINSIGKVGRIAATVLQVLIIIGSVATLLAAIGVMILPKDMLTFTRWSQSSSVMNLDVFESRFGTDSDDFFEGIRLGLEDSMGSLTANGKPVETEKTICDNGSIIFNAQEEGITIDLQDVKIVIVMAFVACVVALVTILFIKKLAKACETCESPFEDNVISAMRNFAISLIPWVVFQTVGNAVISTIMGNSVNVTLNLGLVFVILVLLGLVIVFKYGAMLQKESDETL